MKRAAYLLTYLLTYLLCALGNFLYGQSGIFDRTGIIAGHGSYSSVPVESVDLFTGNLTLRYLDIYLPGPNGLDVEVWRVYNSKVLKDRQDGQAARPACFRWASRALTTFMDLMGGCSPSIMDSASA